MGTGYPSQAMGGANRGMAGEVSAGMSVGRGVPGSSSAPMPQPSGPEGFINETFDFIIRRLKETDAYLKELRQEKEALVNRLDQVNEKINFFEENWSSLAGSAEVLKSRVSNSAPVSLGEEDLLR